MQTLSFAAKAERHAGMIIKNYGKCKITPLVIDEYGDAMPQESVICTTVDEVRELYYQHHDIVITTLDDCNY